MEDMLKRDRIQVKVRTDGRKNRILHVKDDILHVEVKAPRRQGKANAAVEQLLSRVSGRKATITKGFTRSRKHVRLG